MKIKFLALVLLASTLCACGGGGGGGTQQGDNPFTGRYVGDWHTVPAAELGAYDMTITYNNLMGIEVVNTTTGKEGHIDGEIDHEGNFTGVLQYEDSLTQIDLSGTITEPQEGTVDGVLELETGTVIAFELEWTNGT